MKLETAPELNLVEAVFFRINFFSNNVKQNSSHCKLKRVQDQKTYTLDDYKKFLENIEFKKGNNCSFGSNKQDISKVKQKKADLETFFDKRCYIDICNSVPWGFEIPS